MTRPRTVFHDDAETQFVTNLRSVLEARSYSQAAFAKLLTDAGLSWTQTTVSRVLSGARGVSLGEAAMIAEALDTPLELMLGRDERTMARTRLLEATERVEAASRERAAAAEAVENARAFLRSLVAASDLDALLDGTERARVEAALGSTSD